MRYAIYFFFILFAFAGCKDDDQDLKVDETKAENEDYEKWTKIVSEPINTFSQNTISMGSHSGNLFIQSLKSFLHLDRNLQFISVAHVSLDEVPYGQEKPLIGDKWTIRRDKQNNQSLVFYMYLNREAVASFNWRRLILDSLGNIKHGGVHTIVNQNDQFGILYNTHFGDSLHYYYNRYQILENQFDSEFISSIKLGSYKVDENIWWNIKDVSSINNIAYASFDMKSVRIANGRITQSFNHHLRDVSNCNDHLLAVADKYRSDLNRESEILISYDNGLTWETVLSEKSIYLSNLKVIGNQALLINDSHIYLIDIENGILNEIDLIGCDADINDIVKLGDKAVLGTDHGLYYKSWDSFLNK